MSTGAGKRKVGVGGGAILTAPTERGAHVNELGKVLEVKRSQLPEKYGCDFMWVSGGFFHGVQRKAVPDLFASMDDGRLAKECGQAQQLTRKPWLIVEGRVDVVGEVVTVGGRPWHGLTVKSFHKMLDSLGGTFTIVRTWTPTETGQAIIGLWEHTRKGAGTGAGQERQHPRPKPKGAWGTVTNKEWAVHLLQGFDGIGPGVATNIVEKFGGVPLEWTVGMADLERVDGVGKVRAKKLIDALRRVK